MAGSATLHA